MKFSYVMEAARHSHRCAVASVFTAGLCVLVVCVAFNCYSWNTVGLMRMPATENVTHTQIDMVTVGICTRRRRSCCIHKH